MCCVCTVCIGACLRVYLYLFTQVVATTSLALYASTSGAGGVVRSGGGAA